MAAPPAKKESTTITMVLEKWARGQKEQISPVYRINGYPFRLRLKRPPGPVDGRTTRTSWGGRLTGEVKATLMCDMAGEAELWRCATNVKTNGVPAQFSHVFCSWEKDSWERMFTSKPLKTGSSVEVRIVIEGEHGNSSSWNLRPSIDSINPPNGILVIGEEKKEIEVNKEFLATQSPFFDQLFFGHFKEKNMDKIPIGGVEYEEFHNIIKIVYGSSEAVLRGDNVHSVLDLADRFDLKIVVDRVVSYLLSDMAPFFFSKAQILLISEERNLPTLKKLYLSDCSDLRVMYDEIKRDPEFAKFSRALKSEIRNLVFN